MRVLITIPHFYNPAGDGRYASTQPNPQPRMAAITRCLRNLRTLYANDWEVWVRDGDRLRSAPANQESRVDMDIVICTCREQHLLARIALPPDTFEHLSVDCDPMFLGFRCHEVLRDRLGTYDLYGYMEDDLLLHDPAFFTKISWFQQIAGEGAVLQPNRFERYISETVLKKVYIDFEFAPESEVALGPNEPIVREAFGERITLRCTSNAHAGCFFLSNTQMTQWAGHERFGVPDASYVGPLESAATLGLLRMFQVYKPTPSNAAFLEIEHAGQMWSRRLPSVRFGPRSTDG